MFFKVAKVGFNKKYIDSSNKIYSRRICMKFFCPEFNQAKSVPLKKSHKFVYTPFLINTLKKLYTVSMAP